MIELAVGFVVGCAVAWVMRRPAAGQAGTFEQRGINIVNQVPVSGVVPEPGGLPPAAQSAPPRA